MRKIAIIIQRYGNEVCGGAEFYAKSLAKHLKEQYHVTVLTTTSLDLTFCKYYQAGEYEDDGVKIIRFDNAKRDFTIMERLNNDEVATLNSGKETRIGVDIQWSNAWGPYCPALVQYVEKNHDEFDAFIVFTYIYFTSIRTIPLIWDKVIFIPTVHDEIWARLSIFKKLFFLPRFIGFLTEGERLFVRNYYKNDIVQGKIIGCGVDLPDSFNNSTFREKYKIKDNYIVYIGRIDKSKNVDQLINFFISYKKKYRSNLKLVLVGDGQVICEQSDDIIFTGFITEQEKFDCISGALLSVAPSEFESLCIAVLESLACCIPILVNGKCEILSDHCKKGECGKIYTSEDDFVEKLNEIISADSMRQKMGKNALEYINKNYTWDITVGKINQMVDTIVKLPINKDDKKADTEFFLLRDVFTDSQFLNDVIYANKSTVIQPIFNDSNAITVCFTSSDYFVPMCGVAVVSLITNTSKYRKYDILIFTSGMSDRNKKLIGSLATGNCSIRFVEFEEGIFSKEIATHDSYNIYTYYRLMIPQLCQSYKKVLYLDSDMVINRDVADIFDVNIDGFYAAAVLDLTILTWQVMKERHPLYSYLESLGLTEPGTYMQGGVALYNIRMINENYAINDLIKMANARHYQNCDQELLNICFRGKIKFLRQNWNVVVMHPAYVDLYDFWMPKKYYDAYVTARKEPYIIHYSFQQIPSYQIDVDMYEYFWKYARGTVFYESLLVMLLTKVTQSIMRQEYVGCMTEKNIVQKTIPLYKKIIDKAFPKNSKRRRLVKNIKNKVFRRK